MLVFAFIKTSSAQTIQRQSLSNGGSLFTQNGIVMSVTLGQNAHTTLKNNIIITQGFQQQGVIAWEVKTNDAVPDVISISVFPNPTSEALNLSISDSELRNKIFNWFIINQLGQLVAQGELQDTSQSIAVENLPKGEYFLRLRTKETTNKSFVAKFLKIN